MLRMAKPTDREAPAKQQTLSPTDQVFIESYTDQTGDTYLNGAQSYRKYHPTVTTKSAAVLASRKLSDVNIRAAVTAELQRIGAGQNVRLRVLHDVINGTHKKTVTTTHSCIDSSGKKVTTTTTVESTPSASERIKAIDLVNRMTGVYDGNRESAVAARQEWMRRNRRAAQEKRGTGGSGDPQ